MLLKDFLSEGVKALGPLYPASEAHSIMQMLCEERLGTRSYTHILEPGYTIRPEDVSILASDMERLVSGEPIQQVIGKAWFFGEEFRVTPDVLIPRPETEILCQEAIRLCSGKQSAPRILDLCTGSGCISWTLAMAIPGTEVIGVDISDKALEVASTQDFKARIEGSGARAPRFIHADVLDTEQLFDHGMFDLIVSNPPYVMDSQKAQMRVNVLEHEPGLALFVPDEDPLLFYRAIARWSRRFLAEGGKGITEINDLLGPETAAVFSAAGFASAEVIKDLSGRNRFILYS